MQIHKDINLQKYINSIKSIKLYNSNINILFDLLETRLKDHFYVNEITLGYCYQISNNFQRLCKKNLDFDEKISVSVPIRILNKQSNSTVYGDMSQFLTKPNIRSFDVYYISQNRMIMGRRYYIHNIEFDIVRDIIEKFEKLMILS